MVNPALHAKLLNFIATADYPDTVENKLYHRFCDLFIDTFAVSIAGINLPETHRVINYAQSLNQPQDSPIMIAAAAFSPETAALVNGVIAHVLDYDDVTPAWRGHPSAVILPALLAAGYHFDANLLKYAKAYSVGYEVGGRLGRTLVNSHYQKGWHSTSTIGVIAATVACCHLLDFSRDEIAAALGFAIAQAGGTRESFGTMGKPLNAGFAVSAAIRAVHLAGAGLSNTMACLDGPNGFISLYGEGEHLDDEISRISCDSPLLCQIDVEPKHIPMCYAAHRAIVATKQLKREYSILPADVVSIKVISTPHSHDALLTRPPCNPVDAKFSMEYGIASILVDNTISLSSFSDSAYTRSIIHELIPKISLVEDSTLAETRTSKVFISMRDGQTVENCVAELTDNRTNYSIAMKSKLTDCIKFAGLACQEQLFIDHIKEDPNATMKAIFQKPVIAGLREQAFSRIKGSKATQ